MMLSGLGADVLKVEPVRGDGMRARRMGPERGSIPFDLAHRDKQSLAVDTESRAAARLRRQEVAGAVVTTVAAQRQAHQRPWSAASPVGRPACSARGRRLLLPGEDGRNGAVHVERFPERGFRWCPRPRSCCGESRGARPRPAPHRRAVAAREAGGRSREGVGAEQVTGVRCAGA
ncbi:CoA transferase [Streptomyces sp. NPDC001714]|uniref:CoA transferase n=1 Tax=Streptomyces sp. NPDC001714 TaxID=3364603 RepID=UPI0036818340